MTDTTATGDELNGLRILVVEDEAAISLLLEDMLLDFGCEVVGPAARLASALELAANEALDLAILDVNLKGENVWPVATKLREKNVPFVIATGGHVDPPPPEFNDAPVIEKPYTVDRVTPAIEAAFGA